MGKVIATQEAQLKTVNVEIKAVSVNGKQMTLSMFRQLKEEQIVSEDLTLKGIPWGTVNYFTGFCADAELSPSHLHLIWQKGSQLRKACVSHKIGYWITREMFFPMPGMDHIFREAKRINEFDPERYRPFLEEYEALYRDLEDLDQLFIAV